MEHANTMQITFWALDDKELKNIENPSGVQKNERKTPLNQISLLEILKSQNQFLVCRRRDDVWSLIFKQNESALALVKGGLGLGPNPLL